jgi:MFS-type transporter involved in bile tolerance (Atg22 family)
MFEIATIGTLLGAALATRFNVLAVIVVVAVLLVVISAGGIANSTAGSSVAIAMILASASVQVGYLGGGMLWHALHDRFAATPRIDLPPRRARQHR